MALDPNNFGMFADLRQHMEAAAIKEERVAASKVLKGPKVKKVSPAKKKKFIKAIHDALYCS